MSPKYRSHVVTSMRRDVIPLRGTTNRLPRSLTQFLRRSFGHVSIHTVAIMEQVHGTRISLVNSERKFVQLARTDGVITATPGVVLVVQTADCVPVILCDRVRGVVAAVHAGWRGTRRRIATKAIQLMKQRFSVKPRDIRVTIGPCIHRCCYAVSEQRARAFEREFGSCVVHRREGKRTVDLVAANVEALCWAGVHRCAIRIHPHCTACTGRRRYYSYRRGDRGRFFITAVLMSEGAGRAH